MSGGAAGCGVEAVVDAIATLDGDLCAGDGAGGEARKRICIATPDILGPVKNGGIGTAYHHLARSLARSGHEVVIAYVSEQAGDEGLMERTRALYAEYGVEVACVVPRPDTDYIVSRVRAPTFALHDWLRAQARPFDIVHVPDWRGLGYGAQLAKSLGVAFARTHFVVVGHAPTLWAVEGNGQFVSKEQELGWVFMERRSVELADTVICVSAHLLGWMREAGYAMPERAFVWPNLFPEPDPEPEAVRARAARDGAALEEVVFFGRLEPRKGLVVFVDAISRLARQGRAPARVTFLGKVSDRIDALELIRSAARAWPAEVRTLTDYGAEEALAHLSHPGRLAVVPSLLENCSMAILECLQAGIPFVATATGGTPELVAPEDHPRALVAPDHVALGERIAAAAGAPLRAVRPSRDFAHTLAVWERWHAQNAPFEASAARFARRARSARAHTPPVTVCIVHHERPRMLRMAVDSVLEQDYPALEAVLVDDGSLSVAAIAALDDIETQFAARGWRVLRQENLYAGAARNTAAQAAHSEWLLFFDDDNVLFPDAVSRLVRAALFSGADCVPGASIRFTGDGDPRRNSDSHGPPMRFLGAARAWNRVRNVAGDTCALVRREAFLSVGGYPSERLWREDMCFNNRLIHAGWRIEPLPDPVYYYRVAIPSLERAQRPSEAARARALSPFLNGLRDEERAYAAYAATRIHHALPAPPARSPTRPPSRKVHAMAFARRRSGFRVDTLELGVMLDPEWIAETGKRGNDEPVFEFRRNGRILARVRPQEVLGDTLWVRAGLRIPALGDILYSVHDAATGEILSSLAAPAAREARRIVGGLDSRRQSDVRGWVLDPQCPERRRKVALHVDGRLLKVLTADAPRSDIAKRRGSDGNHGFLWRLPESVPLGATTRIEVFDAETGKPLRGSPLRVNGGLLVASTASDR